MKFDVENMQEFKNLLDQASVKTGELIEILQKINEFEFKVKKEPSFNEETRLHEENNVVIAGPTATKSMADAIKETQSSNKPMKDWSRIIIETDERNPEVLVIITADDYQLANGLRIRIKPVYDD